MIDEGNFNKYYNSNSKKSSLPFFSKNFYPQREKLKYEIRQKKLSPGLEFLKEVKNDEGFIKMIMTKKEFTIKRELDLDIRQEILELFEQKKGYAERKILFSILGFVVFGFLAGFAKLPFIGVVVAALLGSGVGLYIGSKIKKKLSRTETIKQLDMYCGYLNSLLQITKQYLDIYKYDLNHSRIVLENCIKQSKMSLLYSDNDKDKIRQFEDYKVRFQELLITPRAKQVMRLSWKLYLCRIRDEEEIGSKEIIRQFYSVFDPYHKIMWKDTKNLLLQEIDSFRDSNILPQKVSFKDQFDKVKLPSLGEMNQDIEFSCCIKKIHLIIEKKGRIHAPSSNEEYGFSKGDFYSLGDMNEELSKLPKKREIDTQFLKTTLDKLSKSSPSKQKSGDGLGKIEESPRLIREDSLSRDLLNNIDNQNNKGYSNDIKLSSRQFFFEDDLSQEEEKKSKESKNMGIQQEPTKSIPNPELDRLLELGDQDTSTWKRAHKSKFITVYKKRTEGSPVVLLKAVSVMPNVPPSKAFRLIHNIKLREKWDTVLTKMRIFDTVNEDQDHMYSLFSTPFGMSNRDFCQKRTKAEDYNDAEHILHLVSVEHPECPKVKKTVRAHTYISGYIVNGLNKSKDLLETFGLMKAAKGYWDQDFVKDGEEVGSVMTVLTQTDIKGLVPKFVVNYAASSAPAKWCKNFRKNANKLMEEGVL